MFAATEGEAAGHHALHALLLFQMSRLLARVSGEGRLSMLEDQDRTFRDCEMIFGGIQHLEAGKSSDALTRYHLEAGIAFLHAQALTWNGTDWLSISHLYTLLNADMSSLPVLKNWAVILMLHGDLESAKAKLQAAGEQTGAQKLPAYHLACAKLVDLKEHYATARTARERSKACQVSVLVAEPIGHDLELID